MKIIKTNKLNDKTKSMLEELVILPQFIKIQNSEKSSSLTISELSGMLKNILSLKVSKQPSFHVTFTPSNRAWQNRDRDDHQLWEKSENYSHTSFLSMILIVESFREFMPQSLERIINSHFSLVSVLVKISSGRV